MGGHQRFGVTGSFLLRNRNYSTMTLVLIEVCVTIAAHIFRLELFLNYCKELRIYRSYFTIPSSRQRCLCTMKCVYLSWSTTCPNLLNYIFSTFLQCLMWFVLSQWSGSKRFDALHLITESSDIHAAHILSFHLEVEDCIGLRKHGS